MNFKKILIIFFLFLINSCDQYVSINKDNINKTIEKKFKNSGFTLIYNKNLNIKKLDNRSLEIFHKSLDNKSYVKITNPKNNKSLIAQIKSNNVKFSNFYNSVISTRIAETLDLDINEPYVEIVLISKNSTFIAKKSKTFDEEKNVAEKAPIDGIQISNLSSKVEKKVKKKSYKKFSYSIKVADFYYKDTAQLMVDKIKKTTSIKKLKILQLSKTNYRVLIGPFSDIKTLKETFEKMNSFYFDNLEILKNV